MLGDFFLGVRVCLLWAGNVSLYPTYREIPRIPSATKNLIMSISIWNEVNIVNFMEVFWRSKEVNFSGLSEGEVQYCK